MSALRPGVIVVRCPHCGEEGRGPDFLSDWDGKTFLLACAHRSNLDEKKGGAQTWIYHGGDVVNRMQEGARS